MPISYNQTFCLAQHYNTTPCWYNYSLSSLGNVTNGTASPNIVAPIMQNIPWAGLGLWAITYVAIFIIFHKSGGREKFMAMGISGFLASIVYAQVGILGNSIDVMSIFAFSFFMLIISVIVYALIKDSGE